MAITTPATTVPTLEEHLVLIFSKVALLWSYQSSESFPMTSYLAQNKVQSLLCMFLHHMAMSDRPFFHVGPVTLASNTPEMLPPHPKPLSLDFLVVPLSSSVLCLTCHLLVYNNAYCLSVDKLIRNSFVLPCISTLPNIGIMYGNYFVVVGGVDLNSIDLSLVSNEILRAKILKSTPVYIVFL